MGRIGKNKWGLKLLAIGLSLALAIPGFSSEIKPARIYPTGKITIYNGDQKIGEFNKEAPFPVGYLIAADGKCGVRMDNIYLVAEDGSLFSVVTSDNLRKLRIKKGTVYFAVSGMSHSLSFITPSGSLAVLDILMNAAAGRPTLKGYVSVTENVGKVGVIGGGSIIVSTQQGEMMLEPGQQLTLAQADMDVGAPEELETSEEEEIEAEEAVEEEKAAKEEKTGMSRNTKIIVGVVSGAVGVGGIVALAAGGGGGGGGGDPVSRSTPTP